ncbi:FHA domain-containing protein [Dactylosporangium sp. CA-139066]|uniref:FHA domain-containing protein n=1 Tax=Dactylosporangium sp. CA-139066 TaxID=3239930 RepID=UPI003D8E27A8
MSQICRICNGLYSDDEPFCPVDLVDLEPYAEPDADAEPLAGGDPVPEPAPARSSACWNCGTEPPDAANTECLQCHRPLEPPALLIRFEGGQVEVRRGERAELGRLGRYARLFRSYPNVSRRHAVVGAEPDGSAWIEPGPTPNGTFVNGREIRSSDRVQLRHDQRIRLALHAEGTVTLFPRPGDTR